MTLKAWIETVPIDRNLVDFRYAFPYLHGQKCGDLKNDVVSFLVDAANAMKKQQYIDYNTTTIQVRLKFGSKHNLRYQKFRRSRNSVVTDAYERLQIFFSKL